MSSIIVRDLAASKDLDRKSLCAIRGGTDWLNKVANVGPLANVNININQSVQQFQQVNVAALNNNTLIGADLGHVKIGVNPSQWGGNWAAA
ncbi:MULTISPECIES: hypothetical protein [unclassified Cupriavidus]|uniref:hypothetical protein n=1 Tax=unclassified Cupriavidus TaxID=2640874 RepID=UPI000884AAC4|nr:hypothetical protein [Cupriavidus sp. YR651]SDC16249.1 hypothetical protein SAMN05216345_101758 [Cupriavidus sp. YR651]